MSADPAHVPAECQLTRRDLLRALGIGGTALATGAGLAAAQSTPEADAPPAPQAGIRKPGGPTVAGKTFELQGDIDAIFRFVREEVRYEAYSGALRGPLGTLWGLAGNSVDQAQLLAAMLNEAKITTRFVTGPIDDSTSTTLLESMNLDLEGAFEHAAKVHALPNMAEREAELADLAAEQQQMLDDLAARAEELIAGARVQLADGIDTIVGALDRAGVTLPESGFSLPERENAQHVWVQYASGTEWVNLDPSFGHAEPGQAFATAESTVDVLPEDLFHTITLRVTAEKLFARQLQRVEVLSFFARSQDLLDEPITLLHLKPESIRGLGLAIEGTLDGTVQYLPHLAIGSRDVVAPVDRITFGSGEGLLDAFGGSDIADGDTVAEWLEATITSPDFDDRHISREVFDRVPPEQRLSGDISLEAIPEAELTDFGDDGGPTFKPFVSLWSIVTAAGDLPISHFDQDYSTDDLYSNLSLVPYGFHLSRSPLSRLLAENGSPRMFADRPNLTALVLAARDRTPEGLVIEPVVDLLFQSTRADQWNADAGPAPVTQVAAGVLNHITERLIMSGPGDIAGDGILLDVSVGRVFEEAKRQRIELAVLLPDAPIPDSVSISARAIRLIQMALDSGHAVLVPVEPVELDGVPVTGWWQVNVVTGETLDVLENGRSTTVPYARTLLIGTRSVPAIRAMSCGAALMFIYAGAIIAISGSLGAFGFALAGEPIGAAVLGASAAQGAAAGAAGTGAAVAIGC